MQLNADKILRETFSQTPGLEFAVLVGSRVNGTATEHSDWDIALQWQKEIDWLEQLGRTEMLRKKLSGLLSVSETLIDLIDVPRSSLAMRANIAEDGQVVMGEDALPWQRFLRRTWRELEDYYWEKTYAA
jgi:predicted nucleotidyltransferase